MIVFPVTRPVGLRAVTASSRAATVPTFSTTKSIARPSAGRASGPDQSRGPLPDVAADDVERQVDGADVFQAVVLEVDKLLRAEVERRLTVAGAPCARTLSPARTRPCWKSPCHAVRPEIGRLVPPEGETRRGVHRASTRRCGRRCGSRVAEGGVPRCRSHALRIWRA
jgi:hypothetical protein